MARRNYRPEEVAKALRQARGLVSIAAQALGCGVTTVYDHIKRNPDVAKAEEEATSSMLDVAEGKLFQAIAKGEAWAITFYLARKGKARGYSERQEITGKDGDALCGFTLKMGNGEKA